MMHNNHTMHGALLGGVTYMLTGSLQQSLMIGGGAAAYMHMFGHRLPFM